MLVPFDRELPGATGFEDQAGDRYGPPAPNTSPGFFPTLGAAVRQDNIIGSTLSAIVPPDPLRVEDGYDTWSDIKGTKYERHSDKFLNVFNRPAADAVKAQIDMEERDRQTLHDAGFMGDVLSIGSAIGDPTIMLPGGAVVRAGKGGYSAVRSALNVGRGAAIQAGAQEAILQSTQETRPLAQSLMAIGGSAIIGSALGAGLSKLVGHAEFNRLSAQVERDLAEKGILPIDRNHADVSNIIQDARSVSAAAAPRDTIQDLSVAGRAAEAVQHATAWMRLNPMIRALDSPSAVYRSIMEGMMETPVYLKKNMEGRPSQQAVETFAKQWTQGAVGEALDITRTEWEALRKAGEKISYREFKEAIGRAMRRGDEGAVDLLTARPAEVSAGKIAKVWRDKVFDPLKEQAIKHGLLPEDVKVTTADSYFTRLYNRAMIDSRPSEFRKIVTDWVKEQTDKAIASLTRSRDERTARIQQTVSDLQLDGPARVARLAELQKALEDYRAGNAAHGDRDAEVNALRRKLAKAKGEGDTAAATQHEADLARVRDAGGQPYRDYLADVRNMRRRINLIRDNIAGKGEAVDRARLQQTDVEAQNVERLYRLKASLEKLEREIDRADPELHAEKLADLREQLLDVVERSEKAQDRIKALEDRAKGGDNAAGERAEKAKAAEGARQERIDRLGQRLDDLADIDPEAAITELRRLIESRITQSARTVEAGGKQIAELAAKIKAGPEDVKALKDRVADLESRRQKIQDDWHQRTQVEMGEGYVEDIADSITSQVTGREARAVPYNIVAAARGPLKERTFNIPDELIEPFLESDIEMVGRRYARVMAADTELAAKYGSPDLKEQVKLVQEDYRRLAQQTEASDLPQDKKEKQLRELAKREQADVRDLEAVRDVLRGQYKVHENASAWGRIVHGANQFNYMRAMGGAVLASLTDAARPMMVHGLMPFMKDGIAPLMKNLKAVKMSAEEARLAGTAGERQLMSRISEMADLTDPYSRHHPVERWMDAATHVFSRLNGLALWTDMMKGIAGTMTQNRLLRNVEGDLANLSKREREYLLFLGIDQDMAGRIGEQFKRHGQDLDGVKIAGTEQWDDVGARRAYRAAVAKDVDSIIVQPGVGDKPLFAYTPTGKALLQFKSFMLASHQRVLMRGLQESPYGFVNGLVSMTALGMLITWLKAAESNRLDKLSDNPGFWIAEGLDRSGIPALLFEVSNTVEKWGGPGLKTGAQALFPGTSQKGPASRYASRSDMATLLGPTADLGDTMVRVIRGLGDGDASEGDVNSIRRLLPFSTLPGIRSILEYGAMPPIRDAVR